MNRENHHPGEDLVQYIGVFECGVQLVYIFEAVADLDLRRNGYKRQVKIKTQPQFKPYIVGFEFDDIIHISRSRIPL